MDIEQELSAIKKTLVGLQASAMISQTQTAVTQSALERLVPQISADTLDGMTVRKWIHEQCAAALHAILLQCPDEQLAAEIQAHIARAARNSGME